MPKPIARVATIVLVAVVLVAAVYLTVQAAFAKAESAGVQAHTVGGLQTNFNHDRSTVAEVESLKLQGAGPSFDMPGKGRGCESEAQVNPNDY